MDLTKDRGHSCAPIAAKWLVSVTDGDDDDKLDRISGFVNDQNDGSKYQGAKSKFYEISYYSFVSMNYICTMNDCSQNTDFVPAFFGLKTHFPPNLSATNI